MTFDTLGLPEPLLRAVVGGRITWTLLDGTWHYDQVADNRLDNPSDDGTFTVNGDQISFVSPGFPPDVYRFTQDADGNLTLEAVHADEVIGAVLTADTWVRTGDAPA